MGDGDGDCPILFTDLDRENILGVVIGEREGRIGRRGGVFVCVELGSGGLALGVVGYSV